MDEEGESELRVEDETRFLVARNGDHLVTPFQCDLCHFRNLQKRDPVAGKCEDDRLLVNIRRANLDALWAREPSTVRKNLDECKRAVKIGQALGLRSPFLPMGPFPVEDKFGMGAAVVMLQRSLDKGSYKDHLQFATMRKMRGAFANVYHASAQASGGTVMAKDSRTLRVTQCATHHDWFERFVRGVHKRMGDLVKPDQALSLDVMHKIMQELGNEWRMALPAERLELALEGAYYLIAYAAALRGEEVSMTNLTGVLKYWEAAGSSPRPHVVVALLGRFKGETGERYHLMPIAATTTSGLEIRLWVGRVITEYQGIGVVNGPMFRDRNGQPMKMKDMEGKFIGRLVDVQDKYPDLIRGDVEVTEEYGLSRSFRRGATSEATNRGVPADVIDANNRWRVVHAAGSRLAPMAMRDHYTDVKLVLNKLLKFSEAL